MMEEFGKFAFQMIGFGFALMVMRIAWLLAEPFLMWATKKTGLSGEMEWERGTAKGRPPVRYVKDGWGRVVYMELDPDAEQAEK